MQSPHRQQERQQQQAYAVQQQQPGQQQQQLVHALGGFPVTFCHDMPSFDQAYATSGEADWYQPMVDYAALLGSCTGVVRTRFNEMLMAPSSITSVVADRLGLVRRPLGGSGAHGIIRDDNFNLEALTEPLEVQLLAGPGQPALEFTLPLVIVTPWGDPRYEPLYEFQLCALDFCHAFQIDKYRLRWAASLTDQRDGETYVVPAIAPKPRTGLPCAGSSSFFLAQDTYDQALQLMAAREAVLARRAAAAAGTASPAQAAASAMQRVDPRAAAAAAARSTGGTPAGPAPGSQAWVDDWAPTAAAGHGRQQGRRSGRGGRRGRGRGRASGRLDAAAGVLSAEAAAAAEAEDIAAALATSLAIVQRPVDDGLDPLPSGLTACSWSAVSATALPAGEAECVICNDEFTELLESGDERLVVQLRCRHTFCELCLRQYNTNRGFRRTQALVCPTCRGPAVPP